MTLRTNVTGIFDLDDLGRLGWPIAWNGTPNLEEENDLYDLLAEAREAMHLGDDAPLVEIRTGQVIATIRG